MARRTMDEAERLAYRDLVVRVENQGWVCSSPQNEPEFVAITCRRGGNSLFGRGETQLAALQNVWKKTKEGLAEESAA